MGEQNRNSVSTEINNKKRNLNFATWKRRGLILRENEITDLLLTEELDLFYCKNNVLIGTVSTRNATSRTFNQYEVL